MNEQKLNKIRARFDTLPRNRLHFQDKDVERLEAEAAALREALETAKQSFISIGWEASPDNKKKRGRMRRIFQTAHEGKLALDAALTADAGRATLERLRRAERTLELLGAAGHVSMELMARTREIISSFEEE